VLTFIFTTIELYPAVLVVLGVRRSLESASWLVAIFAFLTQMIFVVRVGLAQGSRYTHWTIAEKLDMPLFTINGNPFTIASIFRLCLLLSIVYAVTRHTRDAMLRQQAVEQELKGAEELQRVLIPASLPSLPGFSLTSAYTPAQEVGGDFFQIVPLENPPGSTMIVLGDVSGKGLRAAMAVSLIVGATRTLTDFSSNPAEVLEGLNRRLLDRLRGGFATCLVMRLDANGSCTIANAGHMAPYLNHKEVEMPGTLPLGLVAVGGYEEKTVQLQAGDHVVLYTDGLLEARSASGELFGFDRVEQLFAGHPDAKQAAAAAVVFGQQDDITVLTLTRLGLGEIASAYLSAPQRLPARRYSRDSSW
jgi:hypothetical protein